MKLAPDISFPVLATDFHRTRPELITHAVCQRNVRDILENRPGGRVHQIKRSTIVGLFEAKFGRQAN